MYKHASTVRALNDGGIYIRNREDMIRVEYGLFKGLQKLASKLPEEMSEEDSLMLEGARENARKNVSRFKAEAQKKMDSFAEKALEKYGAYGLKISFEGAIHKGKINIRLENDYLGRKGDVLSLKEFKAFTAENLKLRKDYAKFFVEALNEIEKLSNLSSMAYEGKGVIPDNVPRNVPKMVNALFSILKLGGYLVLIFIAMLILSAGSVAVAQFGWWAGLAKLGAVLNWLPILGTIAGIMFVKFMISKIRMYGFKGTLNYLKLKARTGIKFAHSVPSLDYQLGVIAALEGERK